MTDVEKTYSQFLEKNPNNSDSAHGLAHIRRVVANAKKLLNEEDADPEIVIAAAWLHDCVTLPKNHPERSTASVLAAERAVQFLKESGFPDGKLTGVFHAIAS